MTIPMHDGSNVIQISTPGKANTRSVRRAAEAYFTDKGQTPPLLKVERDGSGYKVVVLR